MQNIIYRLYSQKIAHTSRSRASYGVYVIKMLEKIDRVKTASNCIAIKTLYTFYNNTIWCLNVNFYELYHIE